MPKTFDSELRELINTYENNPWKLGEFTNVTPIEMLISAIKSLISKYAPKDIYSSGFDKKSYNQGYNSYRAELFREMNIK